MKKKISDMDLVKNHKFDSSRNVLTTKLLANEYNNKTLQHLSKRQKLEALVSKNSINFLHYSILGKILYSEKKYEKSLKFFSTAIKFKPSIPQLYFHRALVFDELGEYESSILDYTQVLEFTLKKPEVFFNRGVAYFKRKQYLLAMKDFSTVQKLSTTKIPMAFLYLGICLYQVGKFKSAIKEYNKAEEGGLQKKYYLYYNRGIAYEKMGKMQRAHKEFTVACKLNKSFSLAEMHKYTTCYRNEAQVKNVFERLIEMARSGKLKAIYYFKLGNYYMKKKSFVIALSNYNNSISLNGKDYRVYFKRALTFERLKSHNLALKDYTKCLELNPKSQESLIKRTLIILYQKKKNCENMFQKIPEPSKTMPILFLEAYYYYVNNNFEECANLFDELIDQFSFSDEETDLKIKYFTFVYKAKLFKKMKNIQGARSMLKQAISLYKRDSMAFYVLGCIDLMAENYDSSITKFHAALKILLSLGRSNTDYVWKLHYYLGIIYFKKLVFQRSEQEFRFALKKKEHFLIYLHLGKIRLLQQKLSEAVDYFTKVFSINPNYKRIGLYLAKCYGVSYGVTEQRYLKELFYYDIRKEFFKLKGVVIEKSRNEDYVASILRELIDTEFVYLESMILLLEKTVLLKIFVQESEVLERFKMAVNSVIKTNLKFIREIFNISTDFSEPFQRPILKRINGFFEKGEFNFYFIYVETHKPLVEYIKRNSKLIKKNLQIMEPTKSFGDLLIRPWQRIPRYKILLQNCSKKINGLNFDHISSFAERFDKKEKVRKNLQVLLMITKNYNFEMLKGTKNEPKIISSSSLLVFMINIHEIFDQTRYDFFVFDKYVLISVKSKNGEETRKMELKYEKYRIFFQIDSKIIIFYIVEKDNNDNLKEKQKFYFANNNIENVQELLKLKKENNPDVVVISKSVWEFHEKKEKKLFILMNDYIGDDPGEDGREWEHWLNKESVDICCVDIKCEKTFSTKIDMGRHVIDEHPDCLHLLDNNILTEAVKEEKVAQRNRSLSRRRFDSILGVGNMTEDSEDDFESDDEVDDDDDDDSIILVSE